MKNTFLILLALVFSTHFMKAQEFHYGVKAGINFANLYSSNTPVEELTKSRTGLHIGASTELSFSSLFSLEAQILYSQQGAKIEIEYIPITPPGELGYEQNQTQAPNVLNQFTAAESHYDYLNIPILAKFYIYEGINLFAGPQVSLLLSAKDKYESNEVDISDEIDPMDFGLLGGLGYQFKMGFFFSASYYWGINNISHINYENVLGYDINVHQGVLQFSTGYKF